MTIEQLTDFFGWWTLMSLALYLLTVLSVFLFRDKLAAFQARIFGLTALEVKKEFFTYIARFKALILVFNLAPYLALRLFF